MNEPVAWRWKLPSDTKWQFTDGPEKPRLGLPTSFEAAAIKEPVYAAPQAVQAEDVAERPLSLMRADDGRAMWEQISDLIKFHMNERPPIRLRDELVTILDWARYGEARLTDSEAEATSLRRALEEHRRALDIADRLIERGYGIDTPDEWHAAYRTLLGASE